MPLITSRHFDDPLNRWLATRGRKLRVNGSLNQETIEGPRA
jgi:hypothetical protein